VGVRPGRDGEGMSSAIAVSGLRGLIADAVIIGVGLAMGFRPHASFPGWLAAIGIMLLLGFGASWLTVAVGRPRRAWSRRAWPPYR
jgi:ABC-2 type transport system permease protein